MSPARLPAEPRLDAAQRLQPSLAAWLRKALSPAARALLDWVVPQAAETPVYLVGGFVRDLFLGRPSLDLDLVLEGDAIRFGRRLHKARGGQLQTHPAFGTAVWQLSASNGKGNAKLPGHIDLISARREDYAHPGALPTVALADLAADQARRDFSINTLALRLNGPEAGRLHDSQAGLADLRRGLVRTLHPRSFADDPTRMLRALRFARRLGFRLEAQTARQLKEQLGYLEYVSGERIFHELDLALQEPERIAILQSFQRSGLLSAIQPGLRLPPAAAAALQASPRPPAYWQLSPEDLTRLPLALWLMWLPRKVVEAVADRLRFDAGLRQLTLAAARLRGEQNNLLRLPPSALVSRLHNEPLAAVYAIQTVAQAPLAERLGRYARRWRHVQPHTDGHALQRRGLPAGPAYARILTRLRDAWLDGELRTARQEQALLEDLLHDAGLRG